ncbi:MAG: hypothetical protein ACKPA8_03345 [Dolichospermum sp.]
MPRKIKRSHKTNVLSISELLAASLARSHFHIPQTAIPTERNAYALPHPQKAN